MNVLWPLHPSEWVGKERTKRGKRQRGKNKRIRGFSSCNGSGKCADSVPFWRKEMKSSIAFSETP